jgi:hypothetical protein
MRRRYENDIKLYEYVINSNCIGGTIFVDGKNVGVVSSSPLIYVTPKPIISSISISGQGLDKIAIIVSPQNGNDYNILHVSLPVINFVLVSTPITYKKYKVYHNHAPESIYNVVPGLYNLNYTYEIKEETDEGTPGSPTYKALYKDGSKWNLGVVDSNVNIEGRLNNTVSLNTVSIIHIQSNIQDDSYIVFKADVNLYLIDPSDRYNPVYNNTITKQLRYEFK